MPVRESVDRLLPMVREFGALERKRAGEGVTPEEYQRWCELKKRIERHFPQSPTPRGAERRAFVRIPTRMLVEFRSLGASRDAVARTISRGGLFINTSCPPEVGTHLTLLVRSEEGASPVELPCEVVSTNLRPSAAGSALGMGVKFGALDARQRELVDRLFAEALHMGIDEGLG